MTYSNVLDYLSPNTIWRAIKRSVGQIPEAEKSVKLKANSYTKPDLFQAADMVGHFFIRFAGLSGAVAVAMGAYGSHGFYPKKDIPDELKDVYRTANYYHFLHSLALLAVPLTRRPMIVGTLLVSGMTVFCGTCYFHALTGNPEIKQFTPYGGMLLITGWLSMLL